MIENISEEGQALMSGIYQHYKGDFYEVIGVGHHTETEEELVFYRSLQGGYGLWVRPLPMFQGDVEIEGVKKPRFRYLGQPDTLESL